MVAAASYEARRFGVHSALPIAQAYRRCPQAVFLRPRGALYAEVSERFMAILGEFTDLVEPLSIDEAFLDVTASQTLFGSGAAIARRIKEEVRRRERLTASIGVAPVKFVAKIASDLEKPDGLVVVGPGAVRAFLAGVPIARLWGAGPRAVERFHSLGVATIGDVAALSLEQLIEIFGEAGGRHYHALSQGRDERRVDPEHARKSVGRETTFAADVRDRAHVEAVLLNLLEEVAYRMRRKGLSGSTVTVKLRTADFHTVTRQRGLQAPADTTELMWPAVRELFRHADRSTQAIRLVGVAVSDFDAPAQLALFAAPGAEKGKRIAGALDAVAARFGGGAIRRGMTRGRAAGKEEKGR